MSLQYLEDFLEYTEELPQIFCDRLTKVRELDVEVKKREDQVRKLKSSLHQLRRDGKNGLSRTEETRKIVDEKFEKIEKNFDKMVAEIVEEIEKKFDKIVELSGKKIEIIASLEEIMYKFNQHLHEETEKFKLEIEADSPGCTARLEEKAKEEMLPFLKSPQMLPSYVPPHRRPFGQDPSNRLSVPGADIPALTTVVYGKNTSDMRLSAHGTLVENCSDDATTQTVVPSRNNKSRFSTGPVELTEIGSVRLSNDSIAHRKISVFATKSKRLIDKSTSRNSDSSIFPAGESETAPLEEEENDTKKYCFCEGLGDGLMVACDNADCLQEWFHGDCVGIKCEADISGKMWYCPSCSETLEKLASLHKNLGLRPRGPRLNAGLTKDRHSR